MKTLGALVFVLLLSLSSGAWAVNPGEMLDDPALEARAREISAELRCLVCQNQSIDDSDADLAHELRVIVRERLTAGDSNAEAMQYIVDRYGEFVLLRPVLAWHTLALWVAAPAMVLIGLGVILLGARRKRAALPSAELSDEESAALASLAEPPGKK
jgi:cytochrome c-type biogenesis protein CcmH